MTEGDAGRSATLLCVLGGACPVGSVISDNNVGPRLTGMSVVVACLAGRQTLLVGVLCRQRRSASRLMASSRVVSELRKEPRTADVTVFAPGLRTPRMDMQRCSASIMT